ncbi:MAG: cytidylate kinase-like family protein [Phycisphaerales bacterium]|nr:cytidylate kinase-like family protein [Phycisphaerales bacterium]NNM27229.1 cytidylate kinase-like family protein [Phycisphaerales bacterium]
MIRASAVGVAAPPASTPSPWAHVAVTISRQTGTDASDLATTLAESLSRRDGSGGTWFAYDRALVERVAEDHNMSRDLVASLDEHDKTWFEHLTAGLGHASTGADVALKTARTMRALARVGRAIIVGRGGQSVLHGVPAVVHVRLVAPMDWRVARYADRHALSPEEAAKAVQDTDAERARYIQHHYGTAVDDDGLYDVVINMMRVAPATAVDVIARLVIGHRATDASGS